MTAESTALDLRWAALSDTGVSRSENQDFAYAGPLPGNEAWILLAVADGVGGHANGGWASARAMELLAGNLGRYLESGSPAEAFEEAIAGSNSTIGREASLQSSPGAATTMVALLYRDGEAYWANVGDSRLYLISDGRATQISADHSWVADQVRLGKLAPEAAREHPKRNVITRTIGFQAHLRPDTGGPIPIGPADTLVLCSDGLHGTVVDDEIARTVLALEPAPAAEQLVAMANAAGGPDNITVVVASLVPPVSAPAQTAIFDLKATAETSGPVRRSSRRRLFLFGVLVVISTCALGAAAVAWLGGL